MKWGEGGGTVRMDPQAGFGVVGTSCTAVLSFHPI